MRHLTLRFFCCLLLPCSLALSSRADDGWEGHILSFIWENDATASTDKHYTQGAGISYLSEDDALPNWLKRFSAWLPAVAYDVQAQKWGLGLMQEIYTPEDLDTPTVVTNDRPYAGWLYGTATLQRRGQTRTGIPVIENLKIDLGIIGPESLAEETQKSWHGRQPQGWDNQLKTEPGLNLRYNRSMLFSAGKTDSPWRGDFIPFLDGSIGNVHTYFGGGATMRFGYNVPNEFGVSRDQPLRWGAYFFTRAEGRWVLRNIFLDGNSFQDSHHVDKEPIVGDIRIGLTVVLKRVELSAAHTFVSKEFKGEQGTDSYGTAVVTFKF